MKANTSSQERGEPKSHTGGKKPSRYCKYGHLKSGDNLLLRPRDEAKWTTKDGKRKWHAPYTERVCRTCLNRQKREWDAKHARVDNYRAAIRRQELAEDRLATLTDNTKRTKEES